MIFITSDPKLANSQIFVEICEGQLRPTLLVLKQMILSHFIKLILSLRLKLYDTSNIATSSEFWNQTQPKISKFNPNLTRTNTKKI
jgi:hypothetical protein